MLNAASCDRKGRRHLAPAAPPPAAGGEAALIRRLLEGDEEAFGRLVEAYHARLVTLARAYVADPAAAEEVVQETWLAVLEGLPRFEGRSSLKTWIFRILANRAKARAVREKRSIPFSALEGAPDADRRTAILVRSPSPGWG